MYSEFISSAEAQLSGRPMYLTAVTLKSILQLNWGRAIGSSLLNSILKKNPTKYSKNLQEKSSSSFFSTGIVLFTTIRTS